MGAAPLPVELGGTEVTLGGQPLRLLQDGKRTAPTVQPVTVTIGGQAAQVAYAGLTPGYASHTRLCGRLVTLQMAVKETGQERATHGPGCGPHFQQHRRANIRHVLPNVGRRCAAGRGDDRDNRSPDGVADVNSIREAEHRHDNDPAA